MTPKIPDITDDEIKEVMRPLYDSDIAAEMGLADDIRTARAVLAAFLAKKE